MCASYCPSSFLDSQGPLPLTKAAYAHAVIGRGCGGGRLAGWPSIGLVDDGVRRLTLRSFMKAEGSIDDQCPCPCDFRITARQDSRQDSRRAASSSSVQSPWAKEST